MWLFLAMGESSEILIVSLPVWIGLDLNIDHFWFYNFLKVFDNFTTEIALFAQSSLENLFRKYIIFPVNLINLLAVSQGPQHLGGSLRHHLLLKAKAIFL
jgi:hypothetical protein